MRAGEVYEWLDQGPAVLLAPCRIADPIHRDQAHQFLKDPDSWPHDQGGLLNFWNPVTSSTFTKTH